MGDPTTNAILAIALGSVLAVVLLIPTAAVQYRLDGRLGPVDLLVLISSAVYLLALWTYTLLPVPVDGTFACAGVRLDPLISFELVHRPREAGLLAWLREPALQQLLLNVLLFAPLGWFVRVILHRGVMVATLLGLAMSLLIETTQGTGVWGLYSCGYRLFDTNDLLTNTTGALVGSLVSVLVLPRHRRTAPLPTRITFGRRLVGMACDVLFVVLLGGVLAYVDAWLGWAVTLLVESALVLGLGRTVGELVVSLHTRPARLGSRAVKLLTGIGPLFAIAVLPLVIGLPLLVGFGVITVGTAWRIRGHRGLSHTLAAMDLLVGDEEAPV